MENYIKKFNEENYYTKDELKYRVNRNEVDEIWNQLIKYRKEKGCKTIFKSQEGEIFSYYIREIMEKNINFLERSSKRNLSELGNKKLVKKIYDESLIDEAMSSSAIEGAFSTRRRTEELVNGSSNPENKDEKMILNNYHALQFINENNKEAITDQLIFNLHNIITEGTLEENDITERYRDDIVMVKDGNLNIIYEAPRYDLVEGLMKKLIDYINEDSSENKFIKASIIQFIFLYIHPFFDGNGRTARALSYMYLIKNGYEFFKFFSISYVVNEYKSNYYKSILKCEDINSDLTYFIDFNIDMMSKAINNTLERYNNEYLKLEIKKYINNYRIHLTEEQKIMLEKYLKKTDKQLTVKKYSKISGLAESTSIKHLNNFVKNKIFKKIKIDKEVIYILNTLENFIYLNSEVEK
ncbi:MAG: Fic family protein [Cetobacterium sp.]